ncbi:MULTISPECIES: hypothetical protein [Pseudoxanthomonas]|uniref:SHOCT domain-containing protein n=1 Tax=Pseudoxanthomonas winnipegensis TaxID=2480810 RepID=A0AAW8GIM3_9GAMM|nr:MULTISPECIES: hypothetical protein [Pseudoxanthomonas]MDQ1120919.1 hypothetical protein [Pseudoxanthomonas winnipegensis]MDQ1134145.1 hypothetical protein [Pseudoxanthomonas winnipegensis]MDR6139617.1 hypothetical protein [Pseudoxanthomonas sp. SORGH_AS_0997]WJI15748.1 hypothetical protein MWN52_00085 [Pseudoxanthomonas winnipegensis]
MYWLFLLLSLGAMGVALRTTSMALMVVMLLAALGLLVAWALGWYAARAGNGSADGRGMIDPVELHRLREQAKARKAAEHAPTADPRNGP